MAARWLCYPKEASNSAAGSSSAYIRLAPKIPSGQGLGGRSEFGKRSGDGSSDVPAQCRGREQRQQSGNRDYYEQALSRLLRVFDGFSPLLQYLSVNSFHQQ